MQSLLYMVTHINGFACTKGKFFQTGNVYIGAGSALDTLNVDVLVILHLPLASFTLKKSLWFPLLNPLTFTWMGTAEKAGTALKGKGTALPKPGSVSIKYSACTG